MEENEQWKKQVNTSDSKMDNTKVGEATSTITVLVVSIKWSDAGDLHGTSPLTMGPDLPVFLLLREDGYKQQVARRQTAGL